MKDRLPRKWIVCFVVIAAISVSYSALQSARAGTLESVPVATLVSSETPALSLLSQRAKELKLEIVVPKNDFAFRTHHGYVYGSAVRAGAAERYAAILNDELRPYTPTLLAKAGIKKIVLCTTLRLDKQDRNGVPEFGSETLFLEIVAGMHSPHYMRNGIHHEIFHMIDWRDDWMVYEDDEWKKLNAPGFSYLAGGGAAMQGDPYSGLPQFERQGFLNRYSMSGVEEDKAEIFSALMCDAQTLKTRCEADPVLATKTERMKALCKKFSVEMDESFWKLSEERKAMEPTAP